MLHQDKLYIYLVEGQVRVKVYRVFIKYCVSSKNSRKFATSPALGNQLPANRSDYIHSYCIESFKGFLQRCRRGRGCSELCKNTIFPEHPVYACTCLPNKESTRMFDLPGLCRRLNTRDFKWYFKSIKERDSFILTHQTFILSPKPLFF